MDEARIIFYPEDLSKIEKKYGVELTQKAKDLISRYLEVIETEAKEIINEEGYRDTGRLINSIKPSLKSYAAKITGRLMQGPSTPDLFMKARNIQKPAD